MMEPQEIEDEEHEQILERVAAVDVAKASGMVCTRVPHESRPGRRRTRVWQVAATTNAIIELADHLAARGDREGHPGVDLGLLADLVLPAGSGRPGRAAGQGPGREAGPGQAQDGQAGCGVAGQADRAGHAAALLRPAGGDPAAAGLHPAARRPDPGAVPAYSAAGEAAGGRPDQGVGGGQQAGHACRSAT